MSLSGGARRTLSELAEAHLEQLRFVNHERRWMAPFVVVKRLNFPGGPAVGVAGGAHKLFSSAALEADNHNGRVLRQLAQEAYERGVLDGKAQ